MKQALVVYGGWEGHQPQQCAQVVAEALRDHNVDVTLDTSLDAFKTADLSELDLIVPIWTMGQIAGDQLQPVLAAVHDGAVGLGGFHGGMCDAFREATEWQFMTGGQWVAHPGNDGVTYEVNIVQPDHPICQGVNDFTITSEQYYLHVDPAVEVLATTPFHAPGEWYDGVAMPVTWTKTYGRGRVFYTSIGHQADNLRQPDVLRMLNQGLLWAAESRTVASEPVGA